MSVENRQLLNVGCGRHFHRAWRNIDVVSVDPQVEAHDLRFGLPATAGQYDMVYHSHVLEHLTPLDGRRLVEECHRVLKPGGVLRMVVPDLEQIARGYLNALNEAWSEQGQLPTDEQHVQKLARYDWMKLELLDQLVRQTSGGLMGPTMQAATGELAEFIGQRLGREVCYAQSPSSAVEASPTNASPPNSKTRASRPSARVRWGRKLLRWMLGPQALKWLEVGQFLDSGEVHRWMYDRLSLRELTARCRFRDFRVCTATESYLSGFADYELDQVSGVVRKPDSIFVECLKPTE